MFAGKHGLITPRDLFKWAGRGAVGYSELAEAGFMLLAERLRAPNERDTVKRVLERVMKVKVGCPVGLGFNSLKLGASRASTNFQKSPGKKHGWWLPEEAPQFLTMKFNNVKGFNFGYLR